VLRVHAPRLRKGHLEQARAAAALTSLRDRVGFELRAAAAAGLTLDELGRRTGQRTDEVAPILDENSDAVHAADLWLHAATIADLEGKALAALDAAPEQTLGREELRGKLPAALAPRAFDTIVDGLVRRGGAAVDGDRVARRKRAAAPALSPLEQELADRFRTWAVEPPRPKEVAAATGRPEPQVKVALDRLLATGVLTKVKPDLYLASEVVASLKTRLLAHLDAHGQITPQEWKELTGTSRKYSIPLAEYFDGEKVTLRVGDIRRRRK
jgi:selenocysteine-specific elongation factor